jgi:hypothetical protein
MFQEFDIELPTAAKAGKAKKAKDRLPVPQGKLVVKKLSPREAEKMKRLGISAQEIVPENLEAIALSAFKQVSKEVAVDSIAGLADTEDEMMAELTQKVSGIKHRVTDTTIDIDSLPEDKKKEYLSLVAGHLAKYKARLAQDAELAGLPQNLAQSVRDADDDYDGEDSAINADTYVEFDSGDTIDDDVDVAKDIESAVSTRSTEKLKTVDGDNKDSDHQHVGDFCARCGFPKNQNLDIMQVSKEEEERYLVAAATLSAYEQTRKALGGRIEITYRVPSVDDEDAVWLALSSNTDAGRSLELLQRYRLTLQVKSVKLHDGTVKRFPGDYASWCKALKARGLTDVSLNVCWQSMKQSLAMSNSLKNVLFRELFMFNGIVQRLENLSSQENIRNF